MMELTKPYGLNPIVRQWVESFATCAIEGNETAKEMIDLWNAGERDEFVARLERDWLNTEKRIYQDRCSGG